MMHAETYATFMYNLLYEAHSIHTYIHVRVRASMAKKVFN